jgi:hypothetical protein
MKILMTLAIAMISFNASSQNFWSSDFPINVNKFIYKQVHYKCLIADYIDGIITDEVINFNGEKFYNATFSIFGDIQDSYITVIETSDGILGLESLKCPSF